jgi:hypothetical protein
MSRHKLPAKAWPKYRARVLVRLTPLLALAVGVGYWIAVHNSSSSPLSWLLVMPPTMVAIGLMSGLRRTRQWFDSFELEINDDQITRRQAQTPEMGLRRADVKSIVEADGGIVLLGPTRFETIGIPSEIEEYGAVADQVRTWAPAGPRSQRSTMVALATGIAVVLLFGLAFIAPTPVIGATAAAVLALFLVWAFVELRRNLSIDRRTRRASWLVALPAAARVIRVARFVILGE